MLIGVKYCGGCNPNYERSRILKMARAEFPRVTFEPYRTDAAYDLVLMICGCRQSCTTFRCSNSANGVCNIASLEEYEKLRSFLLQRQPPTAH